MTAWTLEMVLQWTPLRFAEETGAWDWVERLMKAGVPQREFTTTKRKLQCPTTARGVMRQVCERGLVSLLQFALSVNPSLAGASLDERGSKPLHVAARNRREVVLRCLLSAGADANCTDAGGRTPLHEAAVSDSAHAARMLLQAGADSKRRDAQGLTPQKLTEVHVSLAVMDVFMSWQEYDDWGEMAVFVMATETGSVERTRRSMVAARRDSPPFLQWTELHWVAMTGSGTAVRTVVATGSAVDARGSSQETPLHGAAAWGAASAVAALIACGADVDARDRSGSAPLHYAARTGNLPALRHLLAAGADAEARDGAGDTPLHRAAAIGAADTVRALLAAGACRAARNADGHTALHLARVRGFKDVVRLLREES